MKKYSSKDIFPQYAPSVQAIAWTAIAIGMLYITTQVILACQSAYIAGL